MLTMNTDAERADSFARFACETRATDAAGANFENESAR